MNKAFCKITYIIRLFFINKEACVKVSVRAWFLAFVLSWYYLIVTLFILSHNYWFTDCLFNFVSFCLCLVNFIDLYHISRLRYSHVNYEVNLSCIFSNFQFIWKEEPDDDVNNFIKDFARILKLWILLPALHFVL